jgi:ubiquinol-cytochrome c reductase cytochrome c subunit
MTRRPTLAAVLVTFALAPGAAPAYSRAGQAAALAAAQADARGDATRGRGLYVSHGCWQCHNRAAQGSIASGPRLAPDPIPLAAFIAYARKPTGQMPPYTTKVMSDAELTDIHAWLEAIPAPPAVSSIPLLAD